MKLCAFVLLLSLPIIGHCQHVEGKEICFVFRDTFNSEVKPDEIFVYDNKGNIFKLDSLGCMFMCADLGYSIILRISDKKYYFIEKHFNAQDLSEVNTIQLENTERTVKFQIVCKQTILNNQQINQIRSFLSSSTHGFHRIILWVGKIQGKEKKVERSVRKISNLYLSSQNSNRSLSISNIQVYYYDLPKDSSSTVFEFEAFDY